jgi:hypothetical protein
MARTGIKLASDIDCNIRMKGELDCLSDCILCSSRTCELLINYIKQVLFFHVILAKNPPEMCPCRGGQDIPAGRCGFGARAINQKGKEV